MLHYYELERENVNKTHRNDVGSVCVRFHQKLYFYFRSFRDTRGGLE